MIRMPTLHHPKSNWSLWLRRRMAILATRDRPCILSDTWMVALSFITQQLPFLDCAVCPRKNNVNRDKSLTWDSCHRYRTGRLQTTGKYQKARSDTMFLRKSMAGRKTHSHMHMQKLSQQEDLKETVFVLPLLEPRADFFPLHMAQSYQIFAQVRSIRDALPCTPKEMVASRHGTVQITQSTKHHMLPMPSGLSIGRVISMMASCCCSSSFSCSCCCCCSSSSCFSHSVCLLELCLSAATCIRRPQGPHAQKPARPRSSSSSEGTQRNLTTC